MACGCQKQAAAPVQTYTVVYVDEQGRTVRQVFTSQIDAEVSAARHNGTWSAQ
jgi:hypothetical protein